MNFLDTTGPIHRHGSQHRKSVWTAAAAVALLLAMASLARAVPTQITVRVLSKGAKFIGTSMGGVQVTLRDADTGEILAAGETRGSTGNTDRIMKEPRLQGGVLSTEGAAHFTTMLDLDEPLWLEVTAFGPLGQRQAANRVTVTQWIVPGKHVNGGDGLLLELPGFAVDALAPAAHARLRGLPQAVTLRANVTMMCGCPITPAGLWNADLFEVVAILKRDGATVGSVPLTYAGETSQFQAIWNIDAAGTYEAVIYAYDPANGNTGLDRLPFLVEE